MWWEWCKARGVTPTMVTTCQWISTCPNTSLTTLGKSASLSFSPTTQAGLVYHCILYHPPIQLYPETFYHCIVSIIFFWWIFSDKWYGPWHGPVFNGANYCMMCEVEIWELRLPRYSNGLNRTLQLLSVMSVIPYQRLLAPWKNFNILKSFSCSKMVMRGSHDSICQSWETSRLDYILVSN